MHEMNKQCKSGVHANRHGRSDKQGISLSLCSLRIYLKHPSEKKNDLISEEQLLVYIACSYLHYVNILWHVDRCIMSAVMMLMKRISNEQILASRHLLSFSSIRPSSTRRLLHELSADQCRAIHASVRIIDSFVSRHAHRSILVLLTFVQPVGVR